jgi:hypothetical protein
MKQDVDSYISTVCQHACCCGHYLYLKGSGETSPWTLYSVCANQRGYNIVFVAVVRLTRFAHFFPIKHPYTSTIAQVAMDNIIKSHGVPNSPLAGRDTQSFSVISGRNCFKLYMIGKQRTSQKSRTKRFSSSRLSNSLSSTTAGLCSPSPKGCICHTRISGHQDPGTNIITRCAGTKSHTYDES